MEALELDDRAGPALPSRWRRRLGDWVEAAGADPDLAEQVALAVGEALSNAVEHAYHDQAPGPVGLRARVNTAPLPPRDDVATGPVRAALVVVVADRGCWQPPAADPGHRGRGLTIIRALAETMELIPSADGTTVRMTWTLRDPA